MISYVTFICPLSVHTACFESTIYRALYVHVDTATSCLLLDLVFAISGETPLFVPDFKETIFFCHNF